MYLYVCVCIFMYICILVCIYTYVSMRACKYEHVHLCTSINDHSLNSLIADIRIQSVLHNTHIHIHIHTRKRAHTHMLVLFIARRGNMPLATAFKFQISFSSLLHNLNRTPSHRLLLLIHHDYSSDLTLSS